ncbi:hypothetical protein NLU13_4981 [Sarocladium strictum]|uniref:RING-type domain-containing protein n=1 Tax=Sarocladium strictum TaxID=5046 RepID=A0AA39GLB7_SARSR|nr:hypothetical protein NLU13_4981 [Sarocladium strictum]
MDHTLTCNTLSCRRELTDRALVTTCSHIFCVECAQKINLANQDNQTRSSCPACGSHLADPDGAVVTILNPSEEYKTSVLSGLSPSIIMECAGRALSFWAYQATQDICYQQYLYKTLSEKYSSLVTRLDKTVNEANSEIDNLHRTISGLMSEQEALRRKNDELVQAYKDKSRKLLQTQELYDKAKRKAEIGLIQQAASEAVDSTLKNAPLANQRDGCGPVRNNDSLHAMPPPNISTRLEGPTMNSRTHRSSIHHVEDGNRWSRPGLPAHSLMTPLNGHGEHSEGTSAFSRQGLASGLGTGTPRPTLHSERASNTVTSSFGQRSGFGGVGLTSGLRVSQAPGYASLDASARLH